MKFRVFWDVAPCSHVEDRRFRGAYCLRHEGIIIALMEAVRTSETSVCFKETTRRYIPEGCYFHTRRRLNLKSHKFIVFSLSPVVRRPQFDKHWLMLAIVSVASLLSIVATYMYFYIHYEHSELKIFK
jgi:hypothetical protein